MGNFQVTNCGTLSMLGVVLCVAGCSVAYDTLAIGDITVTGYIKRATIVAPMDIPPLGIDNFPKWTACHEKLLGGHVIAQGQDIVMILWRKDSSYEGAHGDKYEFMTIQIPNSLVGMPINLPNSRVGVHLSRMGGHALYACLGETGEITNGTLLISREDEKLRCELSGEAVWRNERSSMLSEATKVVVDERGGAIRLTDTVGLLGSVSMEAFNERVADVAGYHAEQ